MEATAVCVLLLLRLPLFSASAPHLPAPAAKAHTTSCASCGKKENGSTPPQKRRRNYENSLPISANSFFNSTTYRA
eukprot:COSAG06_NODE_417_length_15986_cov_832.025493_2_plen_76_part_00